MVAHKEVPLEMPRAMHVTTAGIDEALVPLITHLWQLGFVTRFCCQGDPGNDPARRAYIRFRSRLEAGMFTALAGPMAWDARVHRARALKNPAGIDRWTWDWQLAGDTVRFPARDVPRAMEALARNGVPLAALIAAVSREPAPAVPAPSPQTSEERIGALNEPPEAHRSAPRTCPTCGAVIMGKRKDARFCNRRCQLKARDRSRPSTPPPAPTGKEP
jgi:hypothetical protein